MYVCIYNIYLCTKIYIISIYVFGFMSGDFDLKVIVSIISKSFSVLLLLLTLKPRPAFQMWLHLLLTLESQGPCF